MSKKLTLYKYLFWLLPFGVALGMGAVIVALAGGSPGQVASSLLGGAFGTIDQMARVAATLTALVIVTSGLAYASSAGIYNLGIEGQITLGAIATTFALRSLQELIPAPLTIALALVAGIIGGTLWGLLAGSLNVFGRVSEIFAGLGLNFVAQGLALYLVFGPWKRPGVASMSGTEQFDQSLWLPTLGRTEFSPIAISLAAISLAMTIVLLQRSYFGLELKAVGKNLRAAHTLGVAAEQKLLAAFALCGGFAGLVGALQVLAVFHQLIPSISSNLGFIGLLVVMLTGDALWAILPVATFFSALNVGSLQLPLALNLESSLAGVMQGSLVLFVLLARGWTKPDPGVNL
jgi:simple sugar transport system permease protein